MNENFCKLYRKFIQIKRKGWIKSLRNGPTGVGYTFETLINKKEDCLRKPDFLDIEIKTMKYFSKKKIHLFNLNPTCENGIATDIIVNSLGYPDKVYHKYKVFNANVVAPSFTRIGYKNLKLEIDRDNEKIIFIANNIYGKNYNFKIYWDFSKVKEALYSKLKNLAIIKACYKKINNEDYFYYTNISFYSLKDFETFINLVEQGVISINFKIGIYKDKKRLGKRNDRGTDFTILEKDIELLFDKI